MLLTVIWTGQTKNLGTYSHYNLIFFIRIATNFFKRLNVAVNVVMERS